QKRVEAYRSIDNDLLNDSAINLRLFAVGATCTAATTALETAVLLDFEVPKTAGEWLVTGIGTVCTVGLARFGLVTLPEMYSAVGIVMDEQTQQTQTA